MLIGCSSGTGITSPKTNDSEIPTRSSENGIIKSGIIPIAVLDLMISPDLTKAEIIPSRQADVYGDSWFTVLTNFFKTSPCRDCLAINGISIDSEDHVVLSIYAKHPFKKGNPALPPDGRNRDDLRVFDTKLIVVTKDNAGPTFDEFNSRLSSNIVLNADGYTDMIDPVYDPLDNKDDNTHPYIILFENPNEGNVDPSSATGFSDLANASGHNVMNQDTSSLNDLVLDIEPGAAHEFKLYLTANYGLSAENYLQRLTPRYYLPEFNAKEAWKVEAIVESSSLGPFETESMAEVLVKIWDWQHGATVNPNLASLDEIRASSDIKSVDITAPGLFTGVVSQTRADPIGNGMGDTPLEYHLDIYNESGAGAGTFPALVRVVDEREPAGNQTIPQDGIDNNGFNLAPFDIPGFRTYDYIEFLLTVFWNISPIARFTLSPGSEPLVIGRDEVFNYDASESYDVDGGISTYEWDFDYDRATFNPESGHDSYQGEWKYPTSGIHRIALRVTDNTIPIRTDITYKYVIVLPEQQNIEPRLICPVSASINNLKFPSRRAIKTHENNAYVVIGGNPSAERYIISSTDYGANFNTPLKVSDQLTSTSTQHVGGFDISSTGKIGYAYFDENAMDQNAWFMLNYSDDGLTWGPQQSILSSTLEDYVVDGQLIYGAQDREFLIFNMVSDSFTGIFSSIKYLHRTTLADPFQTPPLSLVTGSLPINEVEFYQPYVAVGDDGQIHITYIVMVLITSNDRFSANYARISADGSQITREPVKINQTGTFDAQKDIDIAVDGQKVYVPFVEWDTLSQFEQVVIVASEDGGETWWSLPVTISDVSMEQIHEDHPISVAVDANHRIHIVWAHDRDQLVPETRDLWYDYSDDGGHTWHADRRIYGDGVAGDQNYPSITIDNLGRVHLVWWNDDEIAGKGVWHTRFRG